MAGKKEKSDNDMHHMKKGVGLLVLGLLILSNALWTYVPWGVFIGAIVAIVGFLKLVVPHNHYH